MDSFEELERWRKAQGYSIAQVCRLLDISWDRYDGWRRSGKVPRMARLSCAAINHRLDNWSWK